jgi:hypothetical protein
VKILIQTGDALRSAVAGLWAAGLVAAAGSFAATPTASAQDGQIECSVTENGTPSRGTVAIEQNGKRVASGACGRPMRVPAGKHKVTVTLEGALDNPRRIVDATVEVGKTARVAVDFDTAVLEVRIETQGQRGTGLVAVERGGKRIGTLGSGVPARLSAGAYRVVVRLGGQEKRFDVDLRPGQRRLVRAQF